VDSSAGGFDSGWIPDIRVVTGRMRVGDAVVGATTNAGFGGASAGGGGSGGGAATTGVTVVTRVGNGDGGGMTALELVPAVAPIGGGFTSEIAAS
jgi:hypothetical protein